MKSRFRRILIGVAIVVGVTSVWLFWPERADVDGVAPDPAAYDVVIRRDEFGVPHVHGHTDADAAFGLAWAHAEDDFATIQDTLMAARGRLASVYGRSAGPVDYFVSLLRIQETVDQGWNDLSFEVRALCDAYAAGINLYAERHPDAAMVGLYPVTGHDVVAAFVQKVPLFFGLDGVLGDLFGEERPDLSVSGAPAVRWGSNVLAVSSVRTADGGTYLAANSHQPWTGPVAWYEAHVSSDEGWNMTGALFPGMPVLALGHNQRVSWSFTVNRPDLIDVYLLDVDPDDPMRYRVDGQWKTFDSGTADIDVKLAGRLRWSFPQEVLWSDFGPVVRRPHGTYAIRYAGMGEVGLVEQLYRMNKAQTFEDWKEALASERGLPSFNIGYADAGGTIAYLYNGLIPQRDPAYDWSGYVPGDTAATIWSDYVPLDDLPWVVDPGSGYIQNSNSTPFSAAGPSDSPDPDSFPAWMGVESQETNRSLRSSVLFGADTSIEFGEFWAIKYDVTYDARSLPSRLADRIAAAAYSGDPDVEAAVRVVAGWDRSADVDDPATGLVVATLAELLQAGVDLDASKLVDGDVSDSDLETAFRAAVGEVVRGHGRVDPPWGEVNRLVRGDLDLPIDGAPDVLRAIYGGLEDGRFVGIAGDSYVMLLRWLPDGTPDAWSIHQFGAATLDPTSPHFADQAALFARGDLKQAWFTTEDVLSHTESEYRPGR